MPETFFTADTHFGHVNIIKHCGRPFGSVEEMDAVLVANWNAVVSRSDDIWHLGDFAYKADAERVAKLFRKLNGRKHLIVGNHDGRATLQLPWSSEPKDRRAVRVPGEELPVICDHYAMRTWPKSHYGAAHLYGHSHGALPGVGKSVDVGVDCWDFRPVSFDQLRPVFARQIEDMERATLLAIEAKREERLFQERAARGDPAAALEILDRAPDVAPEPGDEPGGLRASRVAEDPEVMSGEPCVSGTRVPARTVLAYLKAGRSDVEIFEDYPTLPVDGILAVRRWATKLGFGLPGDG